jgi:sugar/nucleoside kinase (ribokinase family)
MLSVNFNIQELQRHDGGAGHNIAYNLALLDEKALLLGAVGKDFVASSFNQEHIDYRYTITSP